MKKEKSVLKNCKCCSGGAYYTSQYKFFSDGEKRTGFLVWVCNNCRFEKSYKGLKKEFALYLKENEILDNNSGIVNVSEDALINTN
jgi:hypothetical protein